MDSIKEDDSYSHAKEIAKTLERYAGLITPWATAVGKHMLADVNRRNEKAWAEHGNEIGKGMRELIERTPVGWLLQDSLARQVTLIKSLPLEASQRVHAVVLNEMPRSTRSTTIAQEILKHSNIPEWRAKLIARTEVSRASSELTIARARKLGSTGYIWRTVGDFDVRPEHKRMAGKFVSYDNPPSFPEEPTLGPYHAGCGPNCRCWIDPVLPDF